MVRGPGNIYALTVSNTALDREIVRKNIPAWLFHLFNLTFISFIQSILLFLIAAPAYPLLLSSQFESELSTADMAYVVMELSLVLSEWFSDQQQWGTFN